MAKSKEETTTKKSGTKVMACDCKHSFQDERYGKGQRVYNIGAKNLVCTVCSNKRTR